PQKGCRVQSQGEAAPVCPCTPCRALLPVVQPAGIPVSDDAGPAAVRQRLSVAGSSPPDSCVAVVPEAMPAALPYPCCHPVCFAKRPEVFSNCGPNPPGCCDSAGAALFPAPTPD